MRRTPVPHRGSSRTVRGGYTGKAVSDRGRLGGLTQFSVPRCDAVNVGISRRLRAHLTQFLHSSRFHLLAAPVGVHRHAAITLCPVRLCQLRSSFTIEPTSIRRAHAERKSSDSTMLGTQAPGGAAAHALKSLHQNCESQGELNTCRNTSTPAMTKGRPPNVASAVDRRQ